MSPNVAFWGVPWGNCIFCPSYIVRKEVTCGFPHYYSSLFNPIWGENEFKNHRQCDLWLASPNQVCPGYHHLGLGWCCKTVFKRKLHFSPMCCLAQKQKWGLHGWGTLCLTCISPCPVWMQAVHEKKVWRGGKQVWLAWKVKKKKQNKKTNHLEMFKSYSKRQYNLRCSFCWATVVVHAKKLLE